MLKNAIQRIHHHHPWRLRRRGHEAAVLIPITASEHNPEIILTVRSATLKSHRGEVCFPGGKRDPEDLELAHTALRETHEELGIPASHIQLCGALGEVVSKHHLHVTPWVGLVPVNVSMRPNPAEIAKVFKVPIRFFVEQGPPQLQQLNVQGELWELPYWEYESERIWGLTAFIICELLTVGFNMQMPMPSRPERGRSPAGD